MVQNQKIFWNIFLPICPQPFDSPTPTVSQCYQGSSLHLQKSFKHIYANICKHIFLFCTNGNILNICPTTWLWASQVVLLVKNPPANAGDITDAHSIPGSGRSTGGGHDNLLQYSCLENSRDRRAWSATVCRVTKSQTQLKQLSTHAQTSGYISCKLLYIHTWKDPSFSFSFINGSKPFHHMDVPLFISLLINI